MKALLNSLSIRFRHTALRTFYVQTLLIVAAVCATTFLTTEAKAQQLPRQTQLYLQAAVVCLQQGDDYCALKSLQAAARISPELARHEGLVRIARILYARVEASGASSTYSYRPPSRSRESYQTLIDSMKNPYLN